MDILKPELVWIGGRCYRVNPTVHSDEDIVSKPSNQYIEEDLYGDDDEGEDCYQIDQIDRNRFRTTFHVAQAFYAVIIGSKGTTKKRIEGETKTQIKVPKQGEHGPIEITGSTREAVSSSRRRVDLIILSARKKFDITHFMCVPIVQRSIKDNYLKFKQEILGGKSIFGLEESLFQNSDKLHITIFTISLMDNEERRLAGQLLQECQEEIVKPILQENGPIEIKLCGVEYMNDDPSEVDVLYGKVESKPLQQIAEDITDYFVSAGLIQRQYDNVKLHVTLINTLFRKTAEEDSGKSHLPHARKTFDARDILKKYATFEFGRQAVRNVHLSERFTTANDGFYEATAVLKIS